MKYTDIKEDIKKLKEELDNFVVGKTEQPVVVMFRSGLPVIYNGNLLFIFYFN